MKIKPRLAMDLNPSDESERAKGRVSVFGRGAGAKAEGKVNSAMGKRTRKGKGVRGKR